jgi:hypothetical protein
MNADHFQFWCLFTGPAESNPNSRMIRAKTIGVMLMASSIIDKKLPRRGCRAEHRATDSRLRTRRKRSSRRWLNSSSRYFLKRSKTDISQNVKFLFGTLNEVRRIWIAASRLEDSTRQWTGYFSSADAAFSEYVCSPSSNRRRREAEGQLAASLGRYSPLRGCASLAPCRPPFCLYARPIPIFQQALKAGSLRSATGRTTRAGPLSNRALRVAWKAGCLRAAKVFRALC